MVSQMPSGVLMINKINLKALQNVAIFSSINFIVKVQHFVCGYSQLFVHVQVSVYVINRVLIHEKDKNH